MQSGERSNGRGTSFVEMAAIRGIAEARRKRLPRVDGKAIGMVFEEAGKQGKSKNGHCHGSSFRFWCSQRESLSRLRI